MDDTTLRGIAAVCSVAGSVLLAWRVTGILKALGEVATMHDRNFKELAKPTGDVVLAGGTSKWIENAQKLWLLILGFGLSILGGVLQFISIL
ncbi:hypothetical protein [Rhodovulum adriaticum]|uniref:hypothetical protein n=1 Tax=Rhodovulum adriaticum TaxID=35804 RepID=UPI001046C7FF|nr:hypothetical protein [Rhodovulum adriaticum]MBK1637115.1 hypothetical protein [Rhodovulum adriaticum]